MLPWLPFAHTALALAPDNCNGSVVMSLTRSTLQWLDLGLKLVAALVKQLGASEEIVSHHPGTEFIITAPLEAG